MTVAELAGVMGAKRTAELIPLCHPIPLTDLVRRDQARPRQRRHASSAPRPPRSAPTGVEMEALTAASVAALTVYDMVKGVDRSAEIRHVRVSRSREGDRVSGAGPPTVPTATASAPSDPRASGARAEAPTSMTAPSDDRRRAARASC